MLQKAKTSRKHQTTFLCLATLIFPISGLTFGGGFTIPCGDKGTPLFVDWRVGKDIWPMLAEKAWAKLHGSYARIMSGITPTAYQAIANEPSRHMAHKPGYGNSIAKDELWNLLTKNQAKTHPLPVTGGVPADSRDKKEHRRRRSTTAEGVTTQHAFVIMDVGPIPIEAGALQFKNGVMW